MQPLAEMIDQTLLKADAGEKSVKQFCVEAADFGFAAVCVLPRYVTSAREIFSDSKTAVCTVAGFPLGANHTKIKLFEAREAVRQGAGEIDMVMAIGLLKEGGYKAVHQDIADLAAFCHESGTILKVIIETCLLSQQEKTAACSICVEAGADFVKTSTGFGSGGAVIEDVRLMAEICRGSGVKVKASGGIKTYESAISMINAGAERIGTSAGIAILKNQNSI